MDMSVLLQQNIAKAERQHKGDGEALQKSRTLLEVEEQSFLQLIIKL